MRKFLFKTVCLLLAAGALFMWFRSDASVLAGSSALGLDDSDGWLTGNSQDSKAFDVLEAMNTSMLRVELPWNEVELSPGAFAWAYQSESGYMDFDQLFSRLEKRGIQPIVVLSGGPVFTSSLYPQQPVSSDTLLENWKNYVRAAVQQFGSQVDYWQIGSAINDPQSWGQVVFPTSSDAPAVPDPELYADMLKSAYSIIKASGAGDMVILGSLTLGGDCDNHPLYYLQSLNDLDAWYAFDAVSVDLPALQDAPEITMVDACGFAPIQSSGYAMADSIKAIRVYIDETGEKPLWINNLSFDSTLLASKAAERATLAEVVESDYLSRASGLLLAYGKADKVFWAYQPEAGRPAVIALQSYANLAKTLSANASGSGLMGDQTIETLRFRSSGKLSILTWRVQGGDEAVPLVIPDVGGYKLYGYSTDSDSLKTSKGVRLNVDSGGSTALMVSERPVLISGHPGSLNQSLSLLLSDSASQASQGLQAKLNNWVQAQKTVAADKLGVWVAEKQTSLMDSLRASFQQWLRKSLGLAKK